MPILAAAGVHSEPVYYVLTNPLGGGRLFASQELSSGDYPLWAGVRWTFDSPYGLPGAA